MDNVSVFRCPHCRTLLSIANNKIIEEKIYYHGILGWPYTMIRCFNDGTCTPLEENSVGCGGMMKLKKSEKELIVIS